MTSLNNLVNDTTYHKIEPEVLIELPNPKLISDNCTIIMNGHHNFGMSEERDSKENEETEIEKSYLNYTDTDPPSKNNNSIKHSNSDTFPLKESFATSSAEEESDVGVEEPESSTLLLQEQTELSPKSSKNKAKLPTLKSSPSRKQSSQDTHSHVQHRPLGLPQDTTSDDIYLDIKPYWPFSSLACLVIGLSAMITLVLCLVIGLYFALYYRCDGTRQWWQETTFYEIFPASFQDTDGDGFGDMKGLVERLDYIQNLSVDVLRLNSIFSALDYPLEYEHVIDFANIDPHLGRMENFQEVIKEVHKRGMRIILDMNPTVTSDQHTWAAHWLLHRPGPFHYFYINQTNKEGEEPPLDPNPDYLNRNWTPPHRTFGSHLFLNWSNPLLQLEMASIIEMWTAEGIDGFYMKHLSNLHIADVNHVAVLFRQWRLILDKYSVNSTKKVLMVSHEDMEYFQRAMDPLTFNSLPNIVDLVDTSLNLIRKQNVSASTLVNEVKDVLKFWEKFSYPPPIVWHMGSVETLRLASRIGERNMRAALFFLELLPGSFSTFYGDEIGLLNSYDPDTLEVYRGGQLATMQWSSGPQANFTTNDTTPWLPVNPNYITKNVESQAEQLRIFSKLAEEIRGTQGSFPNTIDPHFSLIISRQDYQWYHNDCGMVVSVIASTKTVLLANFGSEILNFSDVEDPFLIDKQLKVLATCGSNEFEEMMKVSQILLQPGDAIIGIWS